MTTHSPDTWLQDYGDLLYRYALVRVHCKETAEDLVQETLLAGLKSWQNFQHQSKVSTWLVGILKYKLADHFRKQPPHNSANEFNESVEQVLSYQFDQQGHWKIDLVEWSTADSALQTQQLNTALQLCLSRLPKRMADLLLLRAVNEISTEECRILLDFQSDNQLWVALSRTRVKLRQCLATQSFEGDQ